MWNEETNENWDLEFLEFLLSSFFNKLSVWFSFDNWTNIQFLELFQKCRIFVIKWKSEMKEGTRTEILEFLEFH